MPSLPQVLSSFKSASLLHNTADLPLYLHHYTFHSSWDTQIALGVTGWNIMREDVAHEIIWLSITQTMIHVKCASIWLNFMK
jgi:hypothetical protein